MGWLQKVDNIHSARCSYCCKAFDIGNMGALTSHMKGKKHCERASSSNSQSFFNHSSIILQGHLPLFHLVPAHLPSNMLVLLIL